MRSARHDHADEFSRAQIFCLHHSPWATAPLRFGGFLVVPQAIEERSPPTSPGGPHDRAFGRSWQCLLLFLRLLKIGAVVTVSVRRVKLAMSEACPNQREFITAFHALDAAAS